MVGWLVDGRCDLARAERQPIWMAERIRLPAARPLAKPLLAETLDLLRRTAADIALVNRGEARSSPGTADAR
jgi:hypothetical protein